MPSFETVIEANTLVLKFASNIDNEVAKQFAEQCGKWPNTPINYVFDFQKVNEIQPSFYRALVVFTKSLKTGGKKLFSMNLSRPLLNQISQDGLTGVFNPVGNIQEIKQKSVAKTTDGPGKIDVNFLNPFLEGTIKTFQTQIGFDAKPGKPYLRKKGDVPQFNIEVAGFLSLVSSAFDGAIGICFPSSTLIKIYEKMFDEKAAEVTDEVQDVAGELLNIIFGQAKTKLNTVGYDLQSALPTIMRGKEIAIKHMAEFTFILPFTTEVGVFELQVSSSTDKF